MANVRVFSLARDLNLTSQEVIARLNTDIDVEYFKHGGILPFVLRKILAQ